MTRDERNLKAAKRVWASFRTRCKAAEQITPSMKLIVEIALDAIGGNCFYCSERLTGSQVSIDHSIPISRGGTSDLENLEAVCKKCNRRKGELTLSEFADLMTLIDGWEPVARTYVLRKLSSVPRFWRGK